MNIPTHISNVIKFLNIPIYMIVKFRTTFRTSPNKSSKSYLLVNNQIHSHNTWSYSQMEYFTSEYIEKQNIVSFTMVFMITYNYLPDVFNVIVSFSILKSKVRNLYPEKYLQILMLIDTWIFFFISDIMCFSSVIFF